MFTRAKCPESSAGQPVETPSPLVVDASAFGLDGGISRSSSGAWHTGGRFAGLRFVARSSAISTMLGRCIAGCDSPRAGEPSSRCPACVVSSIAVGCPQHKRKACGFCEPLGGAAGPPSRRTNPALYTPFLNYELSDMGCSSAPFMGLHVGRIRHQAETTDA
jgi:hypothetical protein